MRIEIKVTEDREGSDAREEWENGTRLEGWVEIEQDLDDSTPEVVFRALMDLAKHYTGNGEVDGGRG